MTTSDPRHAEGPAPFRVLPDPADIARLANEFYAFLDHRSAGDGVDPALPPALVRGVPHPSSVPVLAPLPPAPGLPPAPPPVAPTASTPAPPGEDELRALPASLGGVMGLVPSVPSHTTGELPGIFGLTGAAPAALPAFPGAAFDVNRLPGPVAAPALSGPPFGSRPVAEREAPAPISIAAASGFPGITFPTDPFTFRPEMLPELGLAPGIFDPIAIRRDFPILSEEVNGRPLIWLDNAATTQKPRAVIDRLTYFYEHENSNIHRAAHALAARATDAYEAAREKVRRFLNAPSAKEIIFVRGTTEGINLVAQSWGRKHIQAGDEILVTWLEHHANIVPWQQLAQERGAVLRVAPVDDDGQVLLEEYERLISPRTRLVAFTHVSNALGTVTPARAMIEIAHRKGARVLLDAAQSVSHMRVDMQALDPDFLVFSGHKIFGPTGIGVVFGKAEVLEETPPWQGGGNMIADVTFQRTVYQGPPARFEAGTGNIADAVGLGAALDYVTRIGMENISRYEHDLLVYGTNGLKTVPGLRLIGTAKEKASVLSFVLEGRRTEDVGAALDKEGIAVRSGHHCAQPILRRFGVESTVRPSLAFYNTCAEVDALVAALQRIVRG